MEASPVAKSELWVDVERVAASAPQWPDMEALLRKVATLRAKGNAMLPVNAATATIAFGRAAQALCSLRSMLLSSSSSSDDDDRDKAVARLNDEVAELVLLAKSRFLTFSKKSAFILFAKDSHTASRDDFFHDDGLLKWDAFVAPLVHMDQEFEDRLREVTGDEKDFEPSPHASTHAEMVSYAHTAIHIRRAAEAIHAQLGHSTIDEFLARYCDEEQYHWLIPKNQLLSFMEAHHNGDTLIAFMEMVSLMDRRMRDLLYFNNDVPRSLPRKFQDILKMPTFENLWGSTISVVLNVLLGTQDGLNLRNLLWHGFATKAQFDRAYFTFLCLAVFSLPPPPAPLRKEMMGEPRPLTDFHRFVHNLDFGLGTRAFPDVLSPEQINEVNEVITDNFLIVAGQEELWSDAFRYFAQGHNYRALLVLLPLMEHSMRKLCLYLNDCPMKRGCKLDKILRPTMDNGPNLFYTAWSRPMMHALYDLFQWGECGGGLRHYLAHGSTQGNELIPRDFADRCIAVAIALCLPFRPTSPSIPESGLLHRIWQFIAVDYRPCFHPKALLQKDLAAAIELWHDASKQIAQEQQQARTQEEDAEQEEDASTLACRASLESLEQLIARVRGGGSESDERAEPFFYDFEPFCTSKEQRRVDRLRRVVTRSRNFIRAVRDLADASLPKKAPTQMLMLSVRPLFMGLLHLVLVSVQRLWRVGAEGEDEVTAATAVANGGKEGKTSPGGGGSKNKAVNDYFTDLWNLLDKLRVLQERNDWQRIADFLLFVSRSATSASKSTNTAPVIPPSLASVMTAREGKLYAGLLPRLVAHLQ